MTLENALLFVGITNERELMDSLIFLAGYACGLSAWGLSALLERREQGGR